VGELDLALQPTPRHYGQRSRDDFFADPIAWDHRDS